jgi:hypothetical protein
MWGLRWRSGTGTLPRVTEIVIRNPVGRWMLPLLIGVLQFVLWAAVLTGGTSGSVSSNLLTVVLVGSPLLVVFGLMALAAARVRVYLVEEGIAVRRLTGADAYPWSDIALVRITGVRYGTGNPRVQLVFTDGSTVDLPAPRAWRQFGEKGFLQRAETVRQVWIRRNPSADVQAEA